jgi:hypothetical protein
MEGKYERDRESKVLAPGFGMYAPVQIASMMENT